MKKLQLANFLILLSIFIWKVGASTFSLNEMEPVLAAHSASGIVAAGVVGSLWNSFQEGLRKHNKNIRREASEESNEATGHLLRNVDPSYESDMDNMEEVLKKYRDEEEELHKDNFFQEYSPAQNTTNEQKSTEDANNATMEQESTEVNTNKPTSLPEVPSEVESNNITLPKITSVVLGKDISSSNMLDQMLKNQFDSLPKNCFKLPDNYEKPSLEVFKNCTEKCGPESLKSCLCEIICVQKKVEMAHSLCNCESNNYNLSN